MNDLRPRSAAGTVHASHSLTPPTERAGAQLLYEPVAQVGKGDGPKRVVSGVRGRTTCASHGVVAIVGGRERSPWPLLLHLAAATRLAPVPRVVQVGVGGVWAAGCVRQGATAAAQHEGARVGRVQEGGGHACGGRLLLLQWWLLPWWRLLGSG